MNRKFVASLIRNGHVANEDDHDGMIEYFRTRLIQQPLTDEEKDVLIDFLRRVRSGENIFMRKVSGLAHIIMTMPKYQIK